jgi:hypothetical protein
MPPLPATRVTSLACDLSKPTFFGARALIQNHTRLPGTLSMTIMTITRVSDPSCALAGEQSSCDIKTYSRVDQWGVGGGANNAYKIQKVRDFHSEGKMCYRTEI